MRAAAVAEGILTSTFEVTYRECLFKVQALFDELAVLTSTLFSEKSDGRRRFERHIWLRKKPAATRLKRDFSNVRQNLRDLMSINSESKLSRIELRLESMEGLLAKVAPTSTGADTVSTTGVTFVGYTRPQCNLKCRCSCHFRYGARTPPIVNALLGKFFVGYTGLPVPASICDVRSCASSSVRSVQVTYTFPSWFVRRTIDMVMGSNYFGEPEFNIKIRNRRDYTSEHSVFQLARTGNVQEMKYRFLQRLASPNDVSVRGGSTAFNWALQYAIATQNLETCQLLVQSGADLDIENDYGLTDAMQASQLIYTTQYRKLSEGLTSMLSKIDLQSLWNFSHLHKVVLEILPLNLTEEIKKLAHRSHVNLVDIHNRAPLHWAALKGDAEAVQILLLAGADQHILDVEGYSAFHFAIISGNVKCIDTLLIAGAQVHLRNKSGDSPILISAWANDNSAVVRSLISAGADVMSRNGGNVSPLQSAACLNHTGNVEAFIESGADINAFDLHGDTPLFETVYYGCTDSMNVLLKHQIDYSHRNKSGWTILHVLALYGTIDTMEKIAPHIENVDPTWRDVKGRTALDALNDRLGTDADFIAAFQALFTRLEEIADDASDDSFESAVEMQVLSGIL